MIPALSRWLTVDLERSTSKDAVLRTRNTVSTDGTNFTFGRHHVGHHEQVANVDFEASAVEGHLQLVDDGLACSFNAQVVVDFDDVVGVGSGTVDVLKFADSWKVAANGRQVIFARLVVQVEGWLAQFRECP